MVYVLFSDGFEEMEALAPVDLMRRAAIEVKTIGLTGSTVTGAHGIPVVMDGTLEDVDREKLEMLVLPGGTKGVAGIGACPQAVELIRWVAGERKLLGAICAAPGLLGQLGVLNGCRAVVYPGLEDQLTGGGARVQQDERVTHDKNLITAQAAGSSVDFGLKLVAMLRGWTAAETVRREIHYHGGDRSLT